MLVKESELAVLEEDWATDYKMKQRVPRQIDPAWAKRIDDARSAGPDADATVEAAAQRIFAALQSSCQTEAPRDAKDRMLREFGDPAFRDRVGQRVWQLQIQATLPQR